MTDRELLELAAKAVGKLYLLPYKQEWLIGSDAWNPLKDDGDALRLAVELLFEIDIVHNGIAIRHSSGIKVLEDFNRDAYVATRRAIVRAAAEIGRGMP